MNTELNHIFHIYLLISHIHNDTSDYIEFSDRSTNTFGNDVEGIDSGLLILSIFSSIQRLRKTTNTSCRMGCPWRDILTGNEIQNLEHRLRIMLM
jgi:hypothetical protein